MWQAKLPGGGHSSPCVVGDRIFVTAGEKGKQQATLWLLCLERETGETKWQSELYRGLPPRLHPDNAMAAATPACDGERVIVPFQCATSVVVAACSLDGKALWAREIAPYSTIQGYSASLTFYKSAVIVPVEGPKGCYLTALHRQTGEVVWRRAIRSAIESYAPAVVLSVGEREGDLQEQTHVFRLRVY